MKTSQFLTLALAATSLVDAFFVPRFANVLIAHDAEAAPGIGEEWTSASYSLEKRKGSSSGGGGRGSGSAKGGAGKGGGFRPNPNSRAADSFLGGRTFLGSGIPQFSNGTEDKPRFYYGGAKVPYPAGNATIHDTETTLPLTSLLLGEHVKDWFPGNWTYDAWFYELVNNYSMTLSDGTDVNLPVKCLCQDYGVCGCQENTDEAYLKDLVLKKDDNELNRKGEEEMTLFVITEYEGREYIVINGSLANGTTAPHGPENAAGHNAALGQAGLIFLAAFVSLPLMI